MAVWIFLALWCLMMYLTVSWPSKNKKRYFSRNLHEPGRVIAFRGAIRASAITLCVSSLASLFGFFIVLPGVDGTMLLLLVQPLIMVMPAIAIYSLIRTLVLIWFRPRPHSISADE